MSEIAETQSFHLGDILTVTTGFFVSPNGIGGIYKILNFLTGDELFTHQLPRAGRECEPWLARQVPGCSKEVLAVECAQLEATLADCADEDRSAVVLRWLAERVQQLGEFHDLYPIPREEHERKDAISELEEMVGPERVIILSQDD